MLSKRLTLAAGLILLSLAAFAQSSMTDQQVLDYVLQATAEGKSREAVTKELALKGVDKVQAQRVYNLYKQQQGTNAAASTIQDVPRTHTVNEETPVNESTPITAMSANPAPDQSLDVYGRDIFRNRNLDFSPSENLATPRNYRLGPGDEVIIDVFGANQSTIRSTISPEGSINVDVLGPLYISGMTIDEANAYLKKRLARIYAGLNRSSAGTDIRLSLGQIRTIQVNMLSNVGNPGTYRLSAFSTVFHALYMAGGVVEPGTLRNIQVNRGGKIVGNLDVYEYLETGSVDDIRLEEGDVILVPPYKVMVKLSGMVKRPMYFEMKDGETLTDLFKYAGGFANGAYTESVTVTRQTGKTYEVRTVSEKEFGKFKLQDGDEIEVGKLQSRFGNKLTIFGSVYQPGSYELGPNLHNVKQLVEAAGGLLPDAYLGRAVIHREHEDRTMEVLSVNLGKVMDGTGTDIELQNNDEVHVASGFDLKSQATMTISGLVNNPGSFPYAANTSVQDLIILAGGLQDGASTARIDINRRNLNPDGTVAEKEIAQIFSISVKTLDEDGSEKFLLEPYDEVIVHRSPTYSSSKHVTIDGEVNFAGSYNMTQREERLSDLVAKAGGVNDFAYLRGARLFRQRSEAEQRQLDDEINNLLVQGDTTSVRLLETSRTYGVAINLEDAVKNPGGKNDIILRDGDRIEIPLASNTVRVSGAVMMPNAVAYNSRYTAKKYINMCGGFAQRAKKNHAYIVSMNGAAKPYTPSSRLKAGDEIIVPQKGEGKGADNLTRLASGIGNTVSGLASMVAAVAILVRYTSN